MGVVITQICGAGSISGPAWRRAEMLTPKPRPRGALLLWLGIVAGLLALAGCSTLCTKRLYIYRDTEKKSLPATEMALLISDPALAQAVEPGANLNLQGAQWAPEAPSHPTEVYRLTMDEVDGRKVYQGMCLDVTPTYLCEVQPGNRRVAVRVDLLGPQGQEKFKEVVQLNLQPGRVYFLRPDWQELQGRRLAVKLETLPEAYTPALRARVIDWQRQHSKTASIAD